jgi:hypothetical protein
MTAPGVERVARTLGHVVLIAASAAEHCDAPGELEDWVAPEELTAILERHGAHEFIEAVLDDVILLLAERKAAAA